MPLFCAPINNLLPAAKAFFQMLGVFAEFETNLRRVRQMEGIARAKTKGVNKGRRPSIDADEFRRLYEVDEQGATAIAGKLEIARTSAYGVLKGSEAESVGGFVDSANSVEKLLLDRSYYR